jgi:myo-inositol catabolism protein IolC
MPRGYDRALYILPFDHRGSFQAKMFGWKSPLTEAQTAEISRAKEVVASGLPKEKTGILVDGQFGAGILRNAASKNVVTACPAEKSGQDEADFEYGEDFARHVEAFEPTFCKVLVRYNPQGDRALNNRQATRLKRLSEFLTAKSPSRFMFELLVPAEKPQLEQLNDDKASYDRKLRPGIHELLDAGVEPDLWKVEGLDRREDCESVVAAARAGGRDHVGCIILGRGEDERKVRLWLGVAAEVPGFIGFAVGRTVFWDPLVAWRSKKATRDQTVALIAKRYREFVDLFERANTRLPSEVSDRTRSRHRSSKEA